MPKIQNKTGLPTFALPREIATAHGPESKQGDLRTTAATYLTTPNEVKNIYNGDRLWAKVTMELETGGPVVWGTSAQLFPVLSGKGIQLKVDQPRTVIIGKGTIVYLASTSVNRVSVVIEPLPWLEQILAAENEMGKALAALVAKHTK